MASGPPPVNGNANGFRALFASGTPGVWFNPPMSSRIKTLAAFFLLALSPAIIAGGKKEPETVVSFHMEAADTDNPKMTFQAIVGGKLRYFRRMSEISTRDIQSFSPFPDEVTGGTTYGMAIKLKPHVFNRLAAVTGANVDTWMASSINGSIRDAVKIDKQINDGTLIIWRGVQLAEINELDEKIPRIGKEKPMGKEKDKKKD